MKILASNDVGLIVTGYAYVQKNGQCFIDQNGIHTDDHIPGFKKMTKAVHDADGKIVMQNRVVKTVDEGKVIDQAKKTMNSVAKKSSKFN